MKNLLLILAMAASSTMFAQKGNWYIGGVTGYASRTDKPVSGTKTTTTDWALGPEVGTFLQDDIQLGLALGITGYTVKNNDVKTESLTTISPTLYGRKFFKITDNLSTFAGLYLSYLSGKLTDYTIVPSSETKDSGFSARLGVGVAYALSPRFTAVGQYGLLGYQSVTEKVGGTKIGTISDFAFGVNTVGSSYLSQGNGSGAVFNIGIYYTFKKM